MRQENIDLLEKHRRHSLTVKDGYVKGLNQHEKNDLIKVGREEFFGPNYSPDMWCGTCVFNMVKEIYNAYDKYLSNGTHSV